MLKTLRFRGTGNDSGTHNYPKNIFNRPLAILPLLIPCRPAFKKFAVRSIAELLQYFHIDVVMNEMHCTVAK